MTQLRLPPEMKQSRFAKMVCNALPSLLPRGSIGALPDIHSGTTNFPSFVPAGVGGAGASFYPPSLACLAASLAATNFSFPKFSQRCLTSLNPSSVLNSRCVSSSRLFAERRHG